MRSHSNHHTQGTVFSEMAPVWSSVHLLNVSADHGERTPRSHFYIDDILGKDKDDHGSFSNQ